MTHHTQGGPLGGHRFNDAPGGSQHSPARPASTFPGMPAGSNVDSEWLWHRVKFQDELDMLEDAVNENWTTTVTGTTPVMTLSDDAQPSHALITMSASDNDSWESQYSDAKSTGESYDLTQTGADVYFEIMMRFDDANNDDDTVEQLDWFVGLAVTDTTVIDGATDFIGFSHQDLDSDALARITFVSADAASTSGSLVDGHLTATGWSTLNPTANSPDTLAGRRANKIVGDLEWVTLAFYFDQSTSSVHYYVNRVYEGSADITGQIPDQNLCPTLAFQNGEAVAKVPHICYANWAVRLDLI